MFKKFIAFVVAGSLAVSALAQSASDSAAVEQAKREAAQAIGGASKQTYQLDANGNPVLGADGKPVMTSNSASTMKDSLRMFQGVTGVQGVETTASPAKGKTIKAKVSVNQAFDFSCVGSTRSNRYSAGALAFRVDNCANVAKGVQDVTFAVCDGATTASTCSTDPDYTQSVKVPANTFVKFNGLDLGLGCTEKYMCRLTVKGSYEMGGNDQSLKDDAARANEKSTLVGAQRAITADEGYLTKMQELAAPMVACNQANAQGAETGTYTTCDGQQSVNVGASKTDPKCSQTERTCLKEAVSVNSFTRQCTRTFPLTERTLRTQYDKTATCDIVEYADSKSGTSTNTCRPADVPALDAGMQTVGQTEKKCAKTVKDKDGVESCVGYSWTEYKVSLIDFKTLSNDATPSPVGGACDTNPFSETRVFYCESSWFGRTLTAEECTATYSIDSAGPANTLGLNYTQKSGCGFCLQPKVGETCYGTASPTIEQQQGGADTVGTCGTMDLTDCSLGQTQALNTTGENGGGLVSSQLETYTCRKESKQCVQWSATASEASCVSTDMAQGTDKIKAGGNTSDGSFNNAMMAVAVMDGVGKAAEDAEPGQTIPLLFAGKDLRCKRPVGGIGSIAQKNCCRTDLERPKKGNIIQGGCNMDDVRLAAARRSHYAHYIGDRCSRKLPWPFKSCIERQETYCSFNGILPRLVQEQGRQQLSAMTSGSLNASVKDAALAYRYYDSGGGSWTTPLDVNGVKVAAWQWPSYCSDPKLAAEKLISTPDAKDCPGAVTTWFATCDSSAGCGSLPAEPDDGALNWVLHNVDPLQKLTTAVSRYAVVSGACSPSSSSCNYTVSAWPAGVGGKAVVTKDLTWTLYDNDPAPKRKTSPLEHMVGNVGDLMFAGYPVTGQATGSLPATVPLGFSSDGGQTWQTLNISSNLQDQETTLPGSDVRLTGACDAAANVCTYRITGTATVTAKSWGSASNPDCSGFSPGQVAALDFAKMDLSEWLATVMDKMGNKQPTDLAAKTNAQFQEFNALYTSGKVQGTPPVSSTFARVVPSEGFGPFDVRVSVSGYWPETNEDKSKNVDQVTKVTVDWGDCSPLHTLSLVAPNEGYGFRGTHRYEAPNTFTCLGSPERNVVHKVVITAYTTKSGTQTRSVSVENAWSVMPGANSNNDRVTTPVIVDAPKQGSSPPPGN